MRVARLDEADVFGDDWLASRRGHDAQPVERRDM